MLLALLDESVPSRQACRLLSQAAAGCSLESGYRGCIAAGCARSGGRCAVLARVFAEMGRRERNRRSNEVESDHDW